MTYEEWNLLLAKHFFNEEMAGREVLLYANEALIRRLGASESAMQDFLQAIKAGPSGVTRRGLCQRAMQVFEDWRDKGYEYPPYIAFLTLFVLAPGTEENFAPHAYYPRLRKLLGEPPDSGMPPSFEKMISLWSDLEKWSWEEKHEEFGRFMARIRGQWINVGLPLSQTILSEDERKLLPKIFYRAELDPTAMPAADVLSRQLILHGKDVFSRRTFRLLEVSDEESNVLRAALIDFVFEELSLWDGQIPQEMSNGEGVSRARIQTGLRICLDLDEFARSANCYLRFKATRPFPADGLIFNEGANGEIWSCGETGQGWSTPLSVAAEHGVKRVDASGLSWDVGHTLVDTENEWRARLRGCSVRLFLPGQDEGLPDWIESYRLQRESEFVVLSTAQTVEAVDGWGRSACSDFKQYDLQGLPDGWTCFTGRGAQRSCAGIDALTISSSVRLVLRGGIRTGRGNSYFDFARPQIVVENFSSMPRVAVNGQVLAPRRNALGIWDLPSTLPILTPLAIEVEHEGQTLKCSLRLQPPQLAESWASAPWRNRTGEILLGPEGAGSQGAVVSTQVSLPVGAAQPHLPTHLSDRIRFIGCNPGQICDWPGQPLPSDWRPVWAVARMDRKLWKANFCGDAGQLAAMPNASRKSADKASIKRWKETLWGFRKITEPPALPALRAVWSSYISAAQNV